MRKFNIFYLAFFIFFGSSAMAQNSAGKSDDAARIAIKAFVPKNLGDITPKAQDALKNRLEQIVTKNGIGGSSFDNRFILTAKIVEMSKDFVAGTPPIYNFELEVTLLIGDAIEGTLFSTHVINVKGAGNTETSAYLSSIKKIKDKDNEYQVFIENAKTKIIEYYNTKCDFILKEAETLVGQNEYDAAISKLVSIPEVCKECFDKAMDLTTVVFNQKLEYECQQNITLAKVEIAKDNWNDAAEFLKMITPNLSCYPEASEIIKKVGDHQCAVFLSKAKAAWSNRNASEAAGYLGNVTSDSKCASEADKLSKEIAANVDEKEKQQWDLKMKQQQDKTDIRKAEIESARAIGVAYAKNQPTTVYKISSWWY